jgi:hypothetical protein
MQLEEIHEIRKQADNHHYAKKKYITVSLIYRYESHVCLLKYMQQWKWLFSIRQTFKYHLENPSNFHEVITALKSLFLR